MKHIELFAGCGGLSLGFKNEGFELVMANELSPMAAETFAYNHLNEDLTRSSNLSNTKTYWISSAFPREEMAKRLREKPLSETKRNYRELDDINAKDLLGSLVIGSIIELNTILDGNRSLVNQLRKNLDVVSGGPPCQSFSMAGMRRKDCDKNNLPWEFAKFVDLTKPKIALLENVTGILRPFTQDGEKYHAWFEVAKAFAEVGYIPICLHINAKYVGAAQNRPRFIMLGIREDLCHSKAEFSDKRFYEAIEFGRALQYRTSKKQSTSHTDLPVYDIEKDDSFFESGLFSTLAHKRCSLHTAKDAIGDLRSNRFKESNYVEAINSLRNEFSRNPDKRINHDLRDNKPLVQARFRLYQIMSGLSKNERRLLAEFMRDHSSQKLNESLTSRLLNENFLGLNGDSVSFTSEKQLFCYLSKLQTKKQTQRALVENQPAPTALSIPDDACHWDRNHPRTLTVREMARIQSFPDWFVFRSKVTTGGSMRRYEVPQYTQVGNAVPPLLGQSLAKCIKAILKDLDSCS